MKAYFDRLYLRSSLARFLSKWAGICLCLSILLSNPIASAASCFGTHRADVLTILFPLTRNEEKIIQDLWRIDAEASNRAQQAINKVQNDGELARMVALIRFFEDIPKIYPNLTGSQQNYVRRNPKRGSEYVSKMDSQSTIYYYENEVRRLTERLPRMASDIGLEIILKDPSLGPAIRNESFLKRAQHLLIKFNLHLHEKLRAGTDSYQYRLFTTDQMQALFDANQIYRWGLPEENQRIEILSKAFEESDAREMEMSLREEIRKDSCCRSFCLSCPNSVGLKKQYDPKSEPQELNLYRDLFRPSTRF